MKDKLLYGISTALLAFAMGLGGVMDAMAHEDALAIITHLGYPAYFCVLLGVGKLLGESREAGEYAAAPMTR